MEQVADGNLGSLHAAVRARTERATARTVETKALRVVASRDDAERLALILPGQDAPVALTHWSYGQLCSRAGEADDATRRMKARLGSLRSGRVYTATRTSAPFVLVPSPRTRCASVRASCADAQIGAYPTVGRFSGRMIAYMENKVDRRVDRGVATRQHIIAQATQLFTEHGYEAVSIETILKSCGISRGALYHHFSSKEAVFTAVLEAVEVRIVEHLSQAGRDAVNPLEALRAGCAAWLGLAESDASVRRIVLIDAPSVIGWQAWREMDEAYSLGLLRNALAAAAAAGRLDPAKVEVYAHMLLAVLVEMALLIARSPGDPAIGSIAGETVEQLLSSLLGLKPNAPWTTRRKTAHQPERQSA